MLLASYAGPIRADFQHFYGLDLDAIVEGRTKRPSIVVSLIRNLPDDSKFARALNPAAGWSVGEHLLALVADLLAAGNWQRGDGKGPKPEPLPRPRSTTAASADAIVADTFESADDFMVWRAAQLTPAGGDEEV